MMPLNHILRKCTAGYKLSRSQEQINRLMYTDDIKLFAKYEKELDTLIHTVRIYSQDIGMEFDTEKCTMQVRRGLASIEDSVDASIQRLEDYIEKHEGGLITAIRNNTVDTMDNRMTITRKQKCEEKTLCAF